MTTRSPVYLVLVVLITGMVLAGCAKSNTTSTSGEAAVASGQATPSSSSSGACPTTETVTAAKTKFVLHAGLGSGAFYEWIYKPFRRGSLKLSIHNTGSLAKAALAGVFAVHEMDVAKNDAEGDPGLCKVLIAPIDDVRNALDAMVGKIKHGGANDANVGAVDSAVMSLKQQATSAGSSFTDQTPSAAQIASPPSSNGS